MADIQNERDNYMRLSTSRTVNVDPPGAIVVPGYTGIVLAADVTFLAGGYGKVHGRSIITASLRGIPANLAPQIVWSSYFPLTETGDPLVRIMDGANWPISQSVNLIYATIIYGGFIHTSNTIRIVMMNG